jgi:hypothetical protein
MRPNRLSRAVGAGTGAVGAGTGMVVVGAGMIVVGTEMVVVGAGFSRPFGRFGFVKTGMSGLACRGARFSSTPPPGCRP